MAKAIQIVHEAVASDTDDCILWPRARNIQGYGAVWHEGQMVGAHRLALTLHAGPPAGSLATSGALLP